MKRQPGKRAFNDPATRQNGKASLPGGSLDHFQYQPEPQEGPRQQSPKIAAIDPDFSQFLTSAWHPAKHYSGSGALGNIRRFGKYTPPSPPHTATIPLYPPTGDACDPPPFWPRRSHARPAHTSFSHSDCPDTPPLDVCAAPPFAAPGSASARESSARCRHLATCQNNNRRFARADTLWANSATDSRSSSYTKSR